MLTFSSEKGSTPKIRKIDNKIEEWSFQIKSTSLLLCHHLCLRAYTN